MNSPFTSCIQWVTLQQNLTSRSPKNLPAPWGAKEETICLRNLQNAFEENISSNNIGMRRHCGLGRYIQSSTENNGMATQRL